MGAGGLVFLGEEATAQGRPHAQHGEVVARDDQPLNPLGLPALAERQRALHSSDEAVEDLVPVAIVDEVSEVGGRADALAAAGADDDEPVRFFDRQLPDEDFVDQAEDGRIGADADGQREHGDGGKARSFEQHARAVSQVLPQGFESGPAPDASGIFEDERRVAKARRAGAGLRGLRLSFRDECGSPPAVPRRWHPGATSHCSFRQNAVMSVLLYAGSMTWRIAVIARSKSRTSVCKLLPSRRCQRVVTRSALVLGRAPLRAQPNS